MPPRVVAPVLALDIGNVCLGIDPQPLLEAMGFENLEHFHRFDADGNIWRCIQDFEEGGMTTGEFREWFSDTFPSAADLGSVDAIWGLLLKEEIAGMNEVVRVARDAGLKLVYLSDICPIRYAMVRDTLTFADWVDDAVLSFDVGRHKPHAAMFEAMERGHCDGGVPLLYTDDLEENVQAARERGWRAHRFETVEALMDELRDCLRTLA